jgi:energy-coupling factor transporter ATP-binding protein EcfA2
MYVRLAFSLMLQVDADILLVDEVLAVGDAAFQSKCQHSLREMQEQGTTVLLVTHSMDVIEKNCDRAMLIEDGKIDVIGEPSLVADRYMEILLPEEDEEEEVEEEPAEKEAPGAAVTDLWLNGPDGVRGDAVAAGERITINAGIRAEIDLRHPLLLLELIKHPEGVRISSIRLDDRNPIGPICAGDELTVHVDVENRLGPGDYRVSYALGHWVGGDVQLLERCVEPAPLTVLGSGDEDGVIALEHQVSVDHGVPEKRT